MSEGPHGSPSKQAPAPRHGPPQHANDKWRDPREHGAGPQNNQRGNQYIRWSIANY